MTLPKEIARFAPVVFGKFDGTSQTLNAASNAKAAPSIALTGHPKSSVVIICVSGAHEAEADLGDGSTRMRSIQHLDQLPAAMQVLARLARG